MFVFFFQVDLEKPAESPTPRSEPAEELMDETPEPSDPQEPVKEPETSLPEPEAESGGEDVE